VFAPVLVVLALAGGAQPAPAEVIAQVQVQGNLLTPEAEVIRLAEVHVGMPFADSTIEAVAARLRATRRFVGVEVLKRFASIADPNQITLVILVDEGRVEVDWDTGAVSAPGGFLRGRGPRLMFVPILGYEDGYGFSYGVEFAFPDPMGSRSRLAFPLTWGGEKRAGVELEKNLDRGPFTRVEASGSFTRQENPYFEELDDRSRIRIEGQRQFTRWLRAGVATGWQRSSFAGDSRSFATIGADVSFDTRLDPFLTPNAVLARAGGERLAFDDGPVIRTSLEARGHIGLVGQSLVVVRALREDSDRALPPNFKPLLGGMANLRGFDAGHAIGDTLVAASAELRVPLTSPLSFGKLGVSAFIDAGTVFDKGERLGDQRFDRGVGGSAWLTVAMLRVDLSVARGIGSGTRIQFGAGTTF
jgi:outer membrane translocation and assembly module TamA